MLKYTLGRLGIFVVVFVLLLPVPGPSVLIKALIAVAVSLPLAWVLLRRLRDEATVAIARSVEQRRARREELRAALAGEDDPAADPTAGSATDLASRPEASPPAPERG